MLLPSTNMNFDGLEVPALGLCLERQTNIRCAVGNEQQMVVEKRGCIQHVDPPSTTVKLQVGDGLGAGCRHTSETTSQPSTKMKL
jgi:hypothetical protein